MTDTSIDTPAPKSKAVSRDAWLAKRQHTVTLPSGAVVTIEVPNLVAMAKSGQLPNELLGLVAKPQEEQAQVDPKEQLDQMDAFDRFIVPLTVVDPSITAEDYDRLPVHDIEMIRRFATRQIDMDAVGHHLGGLEVVAEFRQFRGLDDDLSGLLGA